MPRYFAILTMLLLLGMVLTRVFLMKRQGIKAMYFGNIDKKDFLIPPIAIFYFYIIFAAAFHLPLAGGRAFFWSRAVSWIGVLFCLSGLSLLLWSLISFGQSFRVGIDNKHPDKLITTGIFAVSRNPISVAFEFILFGQFLIFPERVRLVYIVGAIWLIHRQIMREEEYLKKHYGPEYLEYCNRVRRYLSFHSL
ncbi:MAG TPA: isoprenylcysteine carboxylmethyltransferase family protein [Pseudomonadales bacterium]|nr:isoprenylcysteine carboxylmethyltransferase family protein [Pseudomonadales bacterium]